MFEIISYDDINRWNAIVQSFENYDVYYLHGYVSAFRAHGDGEPLLLLFNNGSMRGIFVLMKRDIGLLPVFNNVVSPGMLFDAVSPYGYGGFLFDGDVSPESINQLDKELKQTMRDCNIVDCFTRFSPVLNNARFSRPFVDIVDLGSTISMDLNSEETIWSNIISKNRNMIRKAKKSGVEIFHGHGDMELLLKFKEMYDETMKKDNAESYYYFPVSFYESINSDLKNNHELFYAKYDGRIIAMSIMIFANGKMHYHLSCSDIQYRQYAPSNLLIYESAIWGCRHGYKLLHLGGGLGSAEDSLFKFKAAFNRNSDYRFSIGKQIFDRQTYDMLVNLRKSVDANFDMESHFFPLYRAQ